MVAGRMFFITILSIARIVDDLMVFNCFIDMTVPCPHRPVTDGAEYEPGHEKSFEHTRNLQQIVRTFQKRQPGASIPP